MGRQLQLATMQPDEVELLRFIDGLTPIRVFQTFAPSVDELWIPNWEHRQVSTDLYVWPQKFAWKPEYGQTGGPGCPPERAGRSFVSNASAAPVLEFSRSYLDRQQYGRIYWARNFSAPQGMLYDAEAFAKLTDQIWRWIRKVSRRLPDATTYSPYFLPDAWSHYGQDVGSCSSPPRRS